MDGYRDLYRAPASSGYYGSPRYFPSYGVDRRSAYSLPPADPLFSAYARAPVDPYVGYGAYQPDYPLPTYSAPFRSRPPRERANARRRSADGGAKRRREPPQSLGPRKKPFKKSQKNSMPVEKHSPKKAPQKKPSQKEVEKPTPASRPQKSLAATLAKETQDLHSLYRTGVDPATGVKIIKPPAKNGTETPVKTNVTGQKRKADAKKKDEAPLRQKKKAKGKNKKFAKEKKQADKKDEKSAVKADPPAPTEEEKKEMETQLELQKGVCKAVADFLCIPEEKEAAKTETAESEKTEAVEATETKEVEAKPDEVQAKPDEALKLTPEEGKEVEEKAYKFFSELLEGNQDLRKLYIDKKDSGSFECLVCHSIDSETSKRFANLTSLVMHTSMRKQKRLEHRGYGRAVCDALGWESLRAPKRTSNQMKENEDLASQPEKTEESAEVASETREENVQS